MPSLVPNSGRVNGRGSNVMNDPTYWDTVYLHPPLRDLDRVDADETFSWLSGTLPLAGSKVDWVEAAKRHSHRHLRDDSGLGLAKAEVCDRIAQSGPAIHVGDGLSPTGVRIPRNSEETVDALLSIPEHHYFVDAGCTWVVVVSMEGDVDALDLA